MKFTLSWLKDHLDTDASRRRGRRRHDHGRAGGRARRRPGREAGRLLGGQDRRGRAAPQRRPPAGLPGRHRRRPQGDRLRRAQRAGGPDHHLRADRGLHPRHAASPWSRGRCAAWSPTACCARPPSWRPPRSPTASSSWPTSLAVGAPAAEALGPGGGDRLRGDAEPARLAGRRRHRPRPGRRRPRHAEGPVGRAGPRRASPARSRSALDGSDACPAFAGRLIRGVKNGPSPAWLQARLTRHRPAPDQRPGRRHQPDLLRPRPAAARL